MNEALTTQLFALFSVVLMLETLKTLFLGTATSLTRKKLQKYINEEDALWLGGDAVTADHPDAARLFRAQRNNIENLLPFVIVASLYVISGANAEAGTVYFTTFLTARFLHTYAYLNKSAMLRRNAYALAWLAVIATGLHAEFVILRGVF